MPVKKKPVKQRYTVLISDNAESHYWAADTHMIGTSAMDVRRRWFAKHPEFDIVSDGKYVKVTKYIGRAAAKKIPSGRDFMY